MHIPTGKVYESEEAARRAGHAPDDLAPVTVTGQTITVQNGPFKGRVYDRLSDGRRGRRRRDLEEPR